MLSPLYFIMKELTRIAWYNFDSFADKFVSVEHHGDEGRSHLTLTYLVMSYP